MPFSKTEIDTIYDRVMGGERDLASFSKKEIEASKGDLDHAMQNKPELVKALIRANLMKSTDVILRALMDETKGCAPIMEAIANIIAKTLEFKREHDNTLDSGFFADLIKAEVDKTWVAMQGAYADHLKQEKKDN